ncbi:MAG: hypothetical protein H6861_01210 [Rhodospirillales bacterium]|nr:hypothetical protein [Rhodospirillales bacterium]
MQSPKTKKNYVATIFTEEEIRKFFDIAGSSPSKEDFENFCSWLGKNILSFVVTYNENHSPDAKTKKEDFKKYFDEIDKHSTELIKLLQDDAESTPWADFIEQPELLRFEDIDHSRNILNHKCVKALEKDFSIEDSTILAINYATTENNFDRRSLLPQLVALKMTAMALKEELPSFPKGRSKKLRELNAFALGYAIQYSQCFKKPFKLYRHKEKNGQYSRVTPCHQIFSKIIEKVRFCFENDPITDANVINSLEYAQKQISRLKKPR